jgi:hypothetical protein
VKTLTKLMLIAGLGVSTFKLSCQEFKLPHETDPFKFIPMYAQIEIVVVKTNYGIKSGIWYDKNCTSKEDYERKFKEGDGKIEKNDIFLDVDNDGIVDLSLKELDNLVNQYVQKKKLEETSL